MVDFRKIIKRIFLKSVLGSNNPFYGHKHTKETIKKIINAHKNKPISKRQKDILKESLSKYDFSCESFRRAVSLGRKGIPAWNKGKKGIYSKEHLTILSEKMTNRRKKMILPKRNTSIEIKVRGFLESLKIEYFQHKYISEINHGYQCDFFIPSKNLVIECDGNYWHKYPTGRDIDKIRTSELIDKGFKVLRLWEHEIRMMHIEDFKNKINLDDMEDL